MRIDNQLPGGNVIVQQIDGHNALLKRELRDTAGNWFYWKFRAEFDEPDTGFRQSGHLADHSFVATAGNSDTNHLTKPYYLRGSQIRFAPGPSIRGEEICSSDRPKTAGANHLPIIPHEPN